MIAAEAICGACREAEHPGEHGACTRGTCGCRCRRSSSLLGGSLRRPSHEARRIGTLALVQPGQVAVWSSERTDRHGAGRGGVVLQVTDKVDPETAELVREFLCANPYEVRPHVRFDVIREDELDQLGVETVDSTRLVFLVRRMCEQVGKGKSFLDTREADLCIRHIPLLARTVAGESGFTP